MLRAPLPRKTVSPVSPTILVAAAVLAASCAPESQPAPEESEATPSAGGDVLAGFTAAIPDAVVPELDREMALTLAAMPLACLDRPHAMPSDRRTYLDTLVSRRVPGFEETRAFYGCWDWHSAVNSTWALVRINKEFPDLRISALIEEKLDDHLSEEALQGELEFFGESRSFERPYGWAWLLKLHQELSSWEHPSADEWADRVEPLARLFSERMVDHLEDLKRPSRVGTHGNTAFSLAMMLEAARGVRDRPLEEAIVSASQRLFGDDLGCPTAYEPWGSDFLSPCLEEAALMGEVLEPDDFVPWLDRFLPALDSREFAPLTSPTDPEAVVVEPDAEAREADRPRPAVGEAAPGAAAEQHERGEAERERRAAEERSALAATSHLLGLAFIRADAMNRIASRLGEGDPRAPALRRLAALHGSQGFDAMFEADYAGSHWIGTFALKYLLTERTGAR